MENDALRIHAFRDDALGDDDGVALATRIASGEVSATEVIEAALARLEIVNDRLQPIAQPDFEAALERSREAAQGPFPGVPTLIKDNQPLAGFPTLQGSAAVVRGRPARETSDFLQDYLSLGFNYLGKSRLPEFGFSCSTEPPNDPPVPNPWDPAFSAGGSSSGSGVCVAAGVLPMAHGNDGGGSIRIPAACCGLVGLKPTRGRHRVSADAKLMPVNIIGEGVLSRSVRDTAAFWEHMEKRYRNPALPEIGRVEGPGRRLRIGLITRSPTGDPTSPEVVDSIQACGRLLASLGHEVEQQEMKVTAQFGEDFILYYSMLAWFVTHVGTNALAEEWDPARLEPLTRDLARNFVRNLHRAPAATWRLRRSERLYASFFDDCDVVLTPCLSGPPSQLGFLDPSLPFEEIMSNLSSYANFTPLANAAGGPAISVPFGMSRGGLPIASHFFGRHGDERTLLELAFEIEAAKPFARLQDKPASAT